MSLMSEYTTIESLFFVRLDDFFHKVIVFPKKIHIIRIRRTVAFSNFVLRITKQEDD